MNPATRILAGMRADGETGISGAALAKDLGVSRAAIWSRIEDLRKAGYDIAAEVADERAQRPWPARIADGWASAVAVARQVWTFELFDIDDTLVPTTEFARKARRNAVLAMIQAGLLVDSQKMVTRNYRILEKME